jgi:hypothetical protein
MTEQDLEKDMEKAVAEAVRLRPVQKQELSLTDQWTKLTLIERELRDRIRREGQKLINDHDRRWMEIKQDYATRIAEQTVQLEKARDKELEELRLETHAKLREHDMLSQRLQD